MLTRFILDSGAKFLKSLVCHNILIFNTKIFCRQKIAFRNFHFKAHVTSLFCLDINFGWKIHFKWYVFFFLTVYVYVDQVQWPNNETHKKLGASNDENKSDRHFVGTFPHNIPVECMKMQSLGKKQTNPQTIRHMNKVLSKNYKNYISYSVPFKWNVQQLTN